MKLNQIFTHVKSKLDIDTLSSDSRTKTHNGLYFALAGLTVNGHKYISQAIENGAVAIVHSDTIHNKVRNIEYIQVDGVREAMHEASSIFYD